MPKAGILRKIRQIGSNEYCFNS